MRPSPAPLPAADTAGVLCGLPAPDGADNSSGDGAATGPTGPVAELWLRRIRGDGRSDHWSDPRNGVQNVARPPTIVTRGELPPRPPAGLPRTDAQQTRGAALVKQCWPEGLGRA